MHKPRINSSKHQETLIFKVVELAGNFVWHSVTFSGMIAGNKIDVECSFCLLLRKQFVFKQSM